MSWIERHLLLLFLGCCCRLARRSGGASSSSSGHYAMSDYANSTRIIYDGDIVNVIPIPVIMGKDVFRTNVGKRIGNSSRRKAVQDDTRYYPCPYDFVHDHHDIILEHLDDEITPTYHQVSTLLWYVSRKVSIRSPIRVLEKRWSGHEMSPWVLDNGAS